MKPLKGGLKLDGKKEATSVFWTIARPFPPKRVRIPLRPSSDSFATPCVQVGDRVRVGEKIAEAPGAPALAVHASISGKVSEIASFPHPLLGECEAIEITSDGKDELIPEIGHERPDWESFPRKEILRLLHESGIALPLLDFPIETLILNGCESEPYLTSNYALLMSHPVEVLKAGEILLRATQAKVLILVLEDHMEEVVELLKSKIFFHTWSHTRIEVLPSRYPQEDETILVRSLLGRELGPRQSPWEAGVLVQNVATAFAIYEAVALQKPFYERVVTLGGECVAQPGNFWLRVGTGVEEGVKYARGFLRKPEKVILGGPMKGVALPTLDFPILKEARGILGLPSERAKPESVEPCIRCNRCVESCPVSISPVMITLAAEKDLFEVAREYGATFCIECGNCSYVCPAKRPMVQLIQHVNAHVSFDKHN